jgi:hypothetical protein
LKKKEEARRKKEENSGQAHNHFRVVEERKLFGTSPSSSAL